MHYPYQMAQKGLANLKAAIHMILKDAPSKGWHQKCIYTPHNRYKLWS